MRVKTVSIKKKASSFIKKQTDKIFNQSELDDDIIIDEVDLIEDDSDKVKENSLTSIVKLNDINAKDLIDKRVKDAKSSKLNKMFSSRLDEIERRLYGIENDILEDEKCVIKNEEAVELLSHRTEACETRIRVIEDRVCKLERDYKSIADKTLEMDMAVKKESYGFLYLNIKNDLSNRLNSHDKSTSNKCLIALISILLSSTFVWINTQVSLLIGSVLIIIALVIGLSSLMRIIPKIISFLKIKRLSSSFNEAILNILKNDIDLYSSLVEKKKFEKLDESKDFIEFITMKRASMKKNTLNVTVSLIVSIVIFIFLSRYLYLNTAYTFFELISYPFTIITELFS